VIFHVEFSAQPMCDVAGRLRERERAHRPERVTLEKVGCTISAR